MFALDNVGFWNTAVPLGVLMILAVLIPRILVDRETRSHGKVALGIGLSAAALFVCGVGIAAVLTATRGVPAMALSGSAELGTSVAIYARLSAMTAIAWAPILALVWFGHAQSVEARRGHDLVLEDR
ncbi:MAG: hypothetical protein ACU0A6_14975 [Shimia sp.]|uniref:hypothetical protein n=1 Tax=Shimia sp. TaxID=1954381 RepID=UPI004058C7B1